jgi:hypothetical protein
VGGVGGGGMDPRGLGMNGGRVRAKAGVSDG